jgi:hypothetical protein
MTDSLPQDQAPTAPPGAQGKQHGAQHRVKWTREHRLTWWANAASFLSAGAAAAAFVLLFLTLRATQESLVAARASVAEAHEQAVQARRQANIAESQLVATTRARLKLTAITDAYVSRAKGVDVAWFRFEPAYKNFGPSPAENIFFEPYVFIVGAGPSPKQVCGTGPGWIAHEPSADIVFPQDEGEGSWAVQVPLQRLKEEAAKVLAVQPSQPVYVGVVGCLLYRSGSDADTYVTGFVADLHLAGPEQDKPGKYIPLYNVLMAGNGPVEVGIEVKTTDAWAD